MIIIIPATGEGLRFKNAGYRNLKPFIPVVEDKVILDYVINSFNIIKDKFIFICKSKEKGDFLNFAYTRNLDSIVITYDGEKLGPVGAILGVKDQLKNILDQEVIISYCDYGIGWNYNDFLNFIDINVDANAIIPCYHGYHPHLLPKENVYAACFIHPDSYKVFKVIEKYFSNNKFKEFWSPGLYYFRKLKIAIDAFQEQINNNDCTSNEYYVSISNNYIKNVYCYPFVFKFLQLGTPQDLEYVKSKISNRIPKNEDACITNTVILAAGRGERFLSLSYKQPKPFLPLLNGTLYTNIVKSLEKVTTTIYSVGADDHKIFWNNINVRYVKANKIGASYSYLEACSDLVGDTLILPCDLIAKHITKKFKEIRNNVDIILFVTKARKFNYDNQGMFSWVEAKQESNINEVKDIFIKENPKLVDLILIGSFYVKDNAFLVNAIKKQFKDNIQDKGEFYLDRVFKMLLNSYRVSYIMVDDYFSFGTPDEYIESKYWYEFISASK